MASLVMRNYRKTIERILHAGLSYSDSVDAQTSLVICNDPAPTQGKGYQARELGVPLVSDEDFMALLGHVVGGSDVEEFVDRTPAGDQFMLF